MLLTFLACLAGFSAVDKILTWCRVQNPYYLLHAVHNAYIVWSTAPEVAAAFTDYANLATYAPNYDAAAWVFALHVYHILLYYKKFRYDDWLHHATMIAVALPIGCLFPSSVFMGFGLFFTTGLPGGIDYALLFGVRNGLVARETEKRINRLLNVWIRSPGCIAQFAMSVPHLLAYPAHPLLKLVSIIPSSLIAWNGQYFMDQVVRDYAKLEAVAHEHQV
jgi:hypothetical protein